VAECSRFYSISPPEVLNLSWDFFIGLIEYKNEVVEKEEKERAKSRQR
jgi:hypothetical protein